MIELQKGKNMYPMINRIAHDMKEIRMWVIISMTIQLFCFCITIWVINSTLNNIENIVNDQKNVSIRDNNERELVLFEREHSFDYRERKRLQSIGTYRYNIRYTKEDDGIYLLDQKSNRNNNIRYFGRNDFGGKTDLHYLLYPRTGIFRNPKGIRKIVNFSNNKECLDNIRKSKLIDVRQVSESRIYVFSSERIISASIFINDFWNKIPAERISYNRNRAVFYIWQWDYRNTDRIRLRIETGSFGILNLRNFHYADLKRMGK